MPSIPHFRLALMTPLILRNSVSKLQSDSEVAVAKDAFESIMIVLL